MQEGIAIGRSFAIMKNEQIDGNKEMIAFGFMNIVGSVTSCYLTTDINHSIIFVFSNMLKFYSVIL